MSASAIYVSGPNGEFIAYDRDYAEMIISAICRLSGDDSCEFTTTLVEVELK